MSNKLDVEDDGRTDPVAEEKGTLARVAAFDIVQLQAVTLSCGPRAALCSPLL